jgi:hypothetical protein
MSAILRAETPVPQVEIRVGAAVRGVSDGAVSDLDEGVKEKEEVMRAKGWWRSCDLVSVLFHARTPASIPSRI